MRFPLRRVLFGFAAGAAAGWVASLLRTPKPVPDSSIEAAAAMPVEDFGEPAAEPERPKPKKATAPAITPPPGSDHHEGSGAAEPATPAKKPARKRAAKQADPAAAVSEAIGEGRAEITERLAGLEDVATPPEPEKGPARRRRRPATE